MPETFLFSLFPHNILTDSQLAFYMIWCIYRLPLQLMNVYDWRKVHTRWFNFNFTSILPTSSSSLFVQSLTSMLIASIDCGVCQLQNEQIVLSLFRQYILLHAFTNSVDRQITNLLHVTSIFLYYYFYMFIKHNFFQIQKDLFNDGEN